MERYRVYMYQKTKNTKSNIVQSYLRLIIRAEDVELLGVGVVVPLAGGLRLEAVTQLLVVLVVQGKVLRKLHDALRKRDIFLIPW